MEFASMRLKGDEDLVTRLREQAFEAVRFMCLGWLLLFQR